MHEADPISASLPEPLDRRGARNVQEALRHGREYDWPGHHIATLLACMYLLLLPLATAPKDWAFAFLTLWTIIRLPHTWRCYRAFIGMPLLWAALAWVGWQALSFAWSENLAQAWDEFKVHRMLITPLLLWPILDRAPWLVMAALAGALSQNGVQALQELGWLAMAEGGDGRLRGLLHPIHSATWFGAAMCWHLSAYAHVRIMLWRALSAALMVVSLAGLLATGSRGPWIAAAVALLAMLVTMLIRRPHARKPLLAAVIGLVAVIVGSSLMMPAGIRQRLNDAQQEVARAVENQEYWTSTGLRLGLWSWAAEVWRSSPVIGVGAGDFADDYVQLDSFASAVSVARERSMIEEVPGYAAAREQGRDVTAMRGHRRGERLAYNRIDYITRDHAHSTYLHTLAQQGLVGLVLLLGVLAAIAQQCWNDRPDHPYSDGMLFALVCWIVGAQFDCYELNGHQLGLIAFIAALTLPGRPPVRWQRSAVDP